MPENYKTNSPFLKQFDMSNSDDGLSDDQFSNRTISKQDFEQIRTIALSRLGAQERINLSRLMHGADLAIWQLVIATILGSTRPDHTIAADELARQVAKLHDVVRETDKGVLDREQQLQSLADTLQAFADDIHASSTDMYQAHMNNAVAQIETSNHEIHKKLIQHYRASLASEISKDVEKNIKSMVPLMTTAVVGSSLVAGVIGFLLARSL